MAHLGSGMLVKNSMKTRCEGRINNLFGIKTIHLNTTASSDTHTETQTNLSLSLSPGHQHMEGGKGEDRKNLSYTDVVARDIGVLPADLPNLMRARQEWANLSPIPTSVN